MYVRLRALDVLRSLGWRLLRDVVPRPVREGCEVMGGGILPVDCFGSVCCEGEALGPGGTRRSGSDAVTVLVLGLRVDKAELEPEVGRKVKAVRNGPFGWAIVLLGSVGCCSDNLCAESPDGKKDEI